MCCFLLRLRAFSFSRQLEVSQKQPQVIYYRSSEGEDSMAGMQQTGAGGERNERAVQSRSPSEAEVITAGGTQTVFIYVSFEFSSSVLQ